MISKTILLGVVLCVAAGFDPWKELPGYEEAFLSEHSDLYDFSRFEAHEGKRLTAGHLASVRTEWAEEKARVTALVRTLESDPRRAYLRRLRGLLAKDRFFRSVRFEERRGEGDVLLLVQVPEKANRHYVDGVAQNYVPHIETLSRQFREAYVAPLRLKRREDAAFLVIVSLKSRGAYDDYARSTPGGAANENVLAHYDPRHKIAVVWEPGTDPNAPNLLARLEVLSHETMHALLGAYTTAGEPVSRWLNEGMAEYWSHSLGMHKTGSLEFRQRPALDLRTWRGLRASTACDAVIPPIEALIGYREYSDAQRDIMARVARGGHSITAEGALSVFYLTSCLYTMFLAEGASEEVRARFPKLLQAELVGRRGVDAFQDTLGVDDLEALDRAFVEWADELAGGPRTGVAADAASGPPVEPAPGVVDLGIGEPTDEERLGAALRDAGWLDFERALEPAELLSADDRAFLEEARGLVTAVLDAAKAARTNVKLRSPRLIGKVTRVGDEEFDVTPYKKATVTVDRRRLRFDFLESYSKKFHLENPRVLGGLRLIREGRDALASEDGAAAWERHGERWTSAIEAASVREHLAEAQDAVRDPEADPREGLDAIRALFDRHRETASVAARHDRLIEAARALYTRSFDPTRASKSPFAVPMVDVGDGVVELRYDFNDPAELRDFAVGDAAPGYAKTVSSLLPITGRNGTWRVSGGTLEATGDAQIAHRGLFTGPAVLQYAETVREGSGTVMNFGGFARVCTDGRFVGCVNMSLVAATPHPRFAASEQNIQLMIGDEISWTVSVDDQATLRFGDQEVANLGAPLREDGATVLVHRGAGPTRLNWLKIRGRLSESFARQRRDAWVADQLVALEGERGR